MAALLGDTQFESASGAVRFRLALAATTRVFASASLKSVFSAAFV